jgi:hypothetical protein
VAGSSGPVKRASEGSGFCPSWVFPPERVEPVLGLGATLLTKPKSSARMMLESS